MKKTYLSLLLPLAFLLIGCGHTPSEVPPTQEVISQAPKPKPIPSTNLVGVLLPLSGQSKKLGQELRDAVTLSFVESKTHALKLIIEDTKGTPEGAVAAFQRLSRHNPTRIIGPVFSSETKAIATSANSKNISILTLSNDEGIQKPRISVLGHMPRQQVLSVLKHAQENDVTKIVMFAPKNSYGDAVAKAAQEAAQKGMIKLVAAVRFEGKGENLRDDLLKLKDLTYEGIFLGVNGKDLQALLDSFAFYEFDYAEPRVIGMESWMQESLSESLEGAWFAGVPEESKSSFTTSFQEAFGNQPSSLAAIAYDAVQLLMIKDKSAYQGVSGRWTVDDSGNFVRNYAVYEYRSGAPTLVKP